LKLQQFACIDPIISIYIGSIDINKINQLLTDQHSKVILNKLQHLSTQEHDNKLFFFANIISIQMILFYKSDYLSLKLPVNITRELTKLRLSSHSLLIEKVDILDQK
jgi:superfamily I DNA and/or RNA helicase